MCIAVFVWYCPTCTVTLDLLHLPARIAFGPRASIISPFTLGKKKKKGFKSLLREITNKNTKSHKKSKEEGIYKMIKLTARNRNIFNACEILTAIFHSPHILHIKQILIQMLNRLSSTIYNTAHRTCLLQMFKAYGTLLIQDTKQRLTCL